MAETTAQAPAMEQPNQQQAPQPTQAVQKVNASGEHPLAGIKIPAQLVPFKQQLADPMSTFLACFEDKEYGKRAFRKEVEFAVQAMNANSFLVSCAKTNPQDLVTAIENIALCGLSLNPVTKQGYLVPFKGKITFMPSYIGMKDLLVRSGLCINIEAQIVYKDDEFDVEYGSNAHITHKPNPWSKNRKKEDILGCYFIAKLPNGDLTFDTMTFDEICGIEKRSPSYGKQSPWQTDWTEMAKKTLIRRAFKSIPHTGLSEEMVRVLETTIKQDDQYFYDDKKKKISHDDFDEDVEIISEV